MPEVCQTCTAMVLLGQSVACRSFSVGIEAALSVRKVRKNSMLCACHMCVFV